MIRQFTKPPLALRRARLDNVALVPASMLPYKEQWQKTANSLPEGGILVLLPTPGGKAHATAETVASLLNARGHQVTILNHDRDPIKA